MTFTLQDVLDLDGKEQVLTEYKNKVIKRGDDLPNGVTLTPLQTEDDRDRDQSFALGFYRDRDWLFRFFREFQPKTFEALSKAGEFYLHLAETSWTPGSYQPSAYYFTLEDRLFRMKLMGRVPLESEVENVYYSPIGSDPNKSPLGFELAHCWDGNIISISPVTDRLEDPVGPGDQIYLYMLQDLYGAPLDELAGFAFHVEDKHAERVLKKEMKALEKQFPFLKAERKIQKKLGNERAGGGLTRGLRLFRNTCPINQDATGAERIIIQTTRRESKPICDENGRPYMFRVKGKDWNTWYYLKYPTEAIDAYTAHLLITGNTDFDFDPYCEIYANSVLGR